MSSVNKSGKRFTPKANSRTKRVVGLTTPQSSQSFSLSRSSQHTPINAPLSPISQKVSTVLSTEDSGKEVKDTISKSYDNNEENNEPTIEPKKVNEATSDLEQDISKNEEADTTSEIIESRGDGRKASTGAGHIFIQPSVTNRTRLSSLSIPTSLSSAYPQSSRRGSVASNNNSRRGSVIIPSANPIVPSLGAGLGSRRSSVISSLGIVPGGRRPSISNVPIRSTIGEVSRRGSVTNNTGDDEEKPTPIPILKTNKRRRVSINYGLKKRKDVSVGGISIGGSVAIKRPEAPIESISNTVADVGKFIASETENTKGTENMPDENTNIATDAEKITNTDTTADTTTATLNKKPTPSTAPSTEIEKSIEDKKLEITNAERENNQKWMMNKEYNKFELVNVDSIEQGKLKKEDYQISHAVESLYEIRGLHKNDNPALSDNLVFNEKKMRLADLCKPFLPVGKRSKNYEKAIEGEEKINAAKEYRRSIREKARKLRISEEDAIKISENGNNSNDEMDEQQRMAKVKELMEKDQSEENKKHNVPILQIQDGQVTYSHESTVVDRHEETNNSMEKIEENPFENIVTSRTYSKRKTTIRWTPQEVAELLRAISLWGTDFGLIAQLFPHRTRKQIKAKFLSEEKLHPHLIEFALLRKLPVDIREYSGKTGIEFKTLEEYNTQIEELKTKHEEELKVMAEAREQAQAEDREAQLNIHRAVSQGIPSRRSRKAVIAEFRKNEEVVGSIDSQTT
ncbi:Transcription factor TFIIIB component B [Pichia californica]|uniref:Transcription factor TFIIIB component B n=1 Tax=Pichia californica TaxID=460514 RepID=A0A9P7BFX1_9ASCO|nr:Transcription factor TFIIIB component B [[Candida] californica]KAG0691067.1 Transcription factor TFIIIB component B [[Candida] californica]